MEELLISFLNGNKSYVAEELKRLLKNSTEYDLFNDLKLACDDNELFSDIVMTYFYHI